MSPRAWLVGDSGTCIVGRLHADGTFYVDRRVPAFNLFQRYPMRRPLVKIVGESDVKKVVR